MAYYLMQARSTFNWSKDAKGEGSVAGMSGNRAAMIIAAAMAENMTDESGENVIKDLQKKLTAEALSPHTTSA